MSGHIVASQDVVASCGCRWFRLLQSSWNLFSEWMLWVKVWFEMYTVCCRWFSMCDHFHVLLRLLQQAMFVSVCLSVCLSVCECVCMSVCSKSTAVSSTRPVVSCSHRHVAPSITVQFRHDFVSWRGVAYSPIHQQLLWWRPRVQTQFDCCCCIVIA